MNSQNDKEDSGHVKAALIGGIFALLAACVGGFFLIINTMVNNGVIVFGASNPSNKNSQPTATYQYQQPINTQLPSGPIENTQVPIPTTSVQEIIYDCPKYLETGKGKSLSLSIDIPLGEIAFIDGYGFDNKKGGAFVTITGPYQGQHVITDGAFCSGIDINLDFRQK